MLPRIFLDTANVEEIYEAVSTGIVAGVATNPNKIRCAGRTYAQVISDIRSFFKGPVAVEAVSIKADDIVEEAKRLSDMSENMCVKIPGNKEGVKAIARLVPMGIQTNATLIFSAGQALAAGLAGTAFISPFIGRVRDMGGDGLQHFRDIRAAYDTYQIKACVIAASIKNSYDAIEAIKAGADSLALTYGVFNQLFEHPLTNRGIESFAADFQAIYPQA